MQCKLKLNCSFSANWFIKLKQDKPQEIVATFTYGCSIADAYQTAHKQPSRHLRYLVIPNVIIVDSSQAVFVWPVF